MHLQFIGCGDAFGTGGRFNTCFHLVGREINALIDCGATSLVGMNKLAIDRNAINTIFITHFHADHIGGLPFFILEANYVLKRQSRADHRRTARPEIALRRDDGERLSRHVGPAIVVSADASRTGNRQAQRNRPCARDAVSASCTTSAPGLALVIASKPKARSSPIPAIPNGRTRSSISAARPTSSFARPIRGTSRSRATWRSSSLEKHLGQIRPKRLVLTHMSNDMLARRREVPFETAEDGMIVEF